MHYIGVPISVAQFTKVADFLREKGEPNANPIDCISLAIDYWMDNAGWKGVYLNSPELYPSSGEGYHWKDLFLPDGTQARMKYKGKYYNACVDGDSFVYEGINLSPSEFANKVTHSSRNAWRDIWVKRPQDREWILADDLRRSKKIQIAL